MPGVLQKTHSIITVFVQSSPGDCLEVSIALETAKVNLRTKADGHHQHVRSAATGILQYH